MTHFPPALSLSPPRSAGQTLALEREEGEGNIYTWSSLSHRDKASIKPMHKEIKQKPAYCRSLLITADKLVPKSSASCLTDYSSLLHSGSLSFNVQKRDITILTVNRPKAKETRKSTRDAE